jgi:c-di-GMP-binding flagellar brake protein YcgR
MEERRRFPRLDASLGITWHKIAGEDDVVSENISLTGLCMIIYEKLEAGEQLSFSIELPDRSRISATGRVAWCRAFRLSGQEAPVNYDVGVEFLDITQTARRALKQFILFPKGCK